MLSRVAVVVAAAAAAAAPPPPPRTTAGNIHSKERRNKIRKQR